MSDDNSIADGLKAVFVFIGGVATVVLAALLLLAVLLGGFNLARILFEVMV